MDREGSEVPIVLAVVAALAFLFALFVGGMMLSGAGMMGGMMGGGGGPGAWDAGIVALAIVVAGVAIALALRSRARPSVSASVSPPWAAPPTASPALSSTPVAPGSDVDAARIQRFEEAALVKVLDEDERTLYLRIRDAGGTALQRDIVAWGTFSKPKVTRLLDKLERRGLVVRERHGSTNRVRLTRTNPPAS